MELNRVYNKSHTLVYTKGGVACGPQESPDTVEIRVKQMSSTLTLEPSSRDLAKVCQMLDDAFERGQFDKAEEIRKALNIRNT